MQTVGFILAFHFRHIPHDFVVAVREGTGDEFASGSPFFPPVLGEGQESLGVANARLKVAVREP